MLLRGSAAELFQTVARENERLQRENRDLNVENAWLRDSVREMERTLGRDGHAQV